MIITIISIILETFIMEQEARLWEDHLDKKFRAFPPTRRQNDTDEPDHNGIPGMVTKVFWRK